MECVLAAEETGELIAKRVVHDGRSLSTRRLNLEFSWYNMETMFFSSF